MSGFPVPDPGGGSDGGGDGGGGAVDSVNGQTGSVFLTAASIGADPAGTAAAAVTAHNASGAAHSALFAAAAAAANAYADGVGTATLSAANAAAVLKTAYNANTVLLATTDDTPAPVTIGEQTLVGRITGGNPTALSVAQVNTMLGVLEAAAGQRITLTPGVSTLTIAVNLGDGKAGGDILVGGNAASENLDLYSTDHATRGRIRFRDFITLLLEDKNSIAATPMRLMQVPSTVTLTMDESVGNAGNAVYGMTFEATVVVTNAGVFPDEGAIFRAKPTVRNPPATAVSGWGIPSFDSAPIVIANGAAFVHGNVGLRHSPVYSVENSGTLSIGDTGFSNGMVAGSGVTVGSRIGFSFSDGTGSGTYTSQIGIDIAALAKATTNIGIRIGLGGTYSLQLSSTAGTAASGITFGTDTNLYRSAADTLKTDDALIVTGMLTANGSITMGDAKDIVINTSTGTKIGTGTTQKIGFYNATPVVRPSAYTQTFSTADKTHAARTSNALSVSVGTSDNTVADVGASFSQTTLNNNFRDIADNYNLLRADLADTAQLVNSIIDDLQALGLVG